MLTGLIFILFMFALGNFFYLVFPEHSNLVKRFSVSLISIILLTIFYCLTEGGNSILEGIITVGGYFLFNFFAHLLLIKVFKVENYYLYLALFFIFFIIITVFYTALMQDVFNYS